MKTKRNVYSKEEFITLFWPLLAKNEVHVLSIKPDYSTYVDGRLVEVIYIEDIESDN